MTVAVVTLAIALAASLITVGILVRALLSGLKSERASFAAEVLAGKAQMAAELGQRHAERGKELAEGQRDEALAAQAKAEAERDAANTKLVAEQKALAKALQENAHATVVKIRSAGSADLAMDALNELLQATRRTEAVPATGDSAAPASDDHR